MRLRSVSVVPRIARTGLASAPVVILLSAASVLLCAGSALAITDLAVAPGSVPVGVTAEITATATVSNPGDLVRIEVVLDIDGDGTADPGEPIRRRFDVTDGAGSILPPVVADDDGAADGAIRCRLPEGGSFAVAASYVVRATDSAGAAEAPYEVVHAPTGQWITGRVVDELGIPVPGAYAVGQRPGHPDVLAVAAGVDGTFTWYADATGPHFAVAAFPGYLTDMDNGGAAIIDVAPGANPLPADLVLAAGTTTASGEVQAEGSGLPFVQLIGEGESETGQYVVIDSTNELGAFSVPVSPGDWELSATDGDLQAFGRVRAESAARTVDPGGVTGWTLDTAAADGWIEGTVIDGRTGLPLPGIEIEAEADPWGTSARTDPAGEFTIAATAGTWSLRIPEDVLVHLDLCPPEPVSVEVPTGGSPPRVVFETRPGRWIAGAVRDADTLAPLEGMEFVRIDSATGAWNSADDTASGEEGAYRVLAAADRDWILYCRGDPPSYLGRFSGNAVAQSEATLIPAGTGTVADVDFYLDEAAVVRGSVSDGISSAAISGAWVTASTAAWVDLPPTITDPSGGYVLYVPSTSVTVRAIADGYGRQHWDHAAIFADATPLDLSGGGEAAGIVFDLPPLGVISGRIAGGDPSSALEGIEISVHSHPDGECLAFVSAAADGAFTVEVGPGNRALWIHGAPGWLGEWYAGHPEYGADAADADPLAVVSGGTNDVGTIVLDPGAVISGVVTESPGDAPVSGANVFAQAPGQSAGGSTWGTGADGRYEVTVPTGHVYQVWAEAPAHAMVIYDNTFDWGDADLVDLTGTTRVDDVDFALPTGDLVSGTVTEFEGGGVSSNAWVEVVDVAGGAPVRSTTTGADGAFGLSLPTGSYLVRASRGGRITGWYDAAWREQDAAPVAVAAGAPRAGTDIVLVAEEGDSDGDGMPNRWEADSGLDPTFPDNDDDADGDRADNGHEYDAGTDPRDPASVFAATVTRVGDAARVEWPTASGHPYQLQRAPGCGGPWTTIHTFPPTSAPTIEWVDSVGAAMSNAAYRVYAP